MKTLAIPSLLLPVALILACPALADGADDASRWDKDMAAFEERDRQSPPAEGALLFVGSSSIKLWDLEKSWPDRATINNGFGGSTLADSIAHFDRLFAPYDPAAIVIYAGDNDIARGLSPEEFLADFKTLASKIEAKLPGVPVIFLAVKPSRQRWDLWPTMKAGNALVADYCEGRENLYFADIAEPMLAGRDEAPAEDWFVADGLHLSESGYARWTKVVDALLPEEERE
ncbi:MAG: GDSL-type esterase/lipase family protein [Verrucomicrobiales bacterium]